MKNHISVISLVLLIAGILFGCTEGVGWVPTKQESQEIQEDLDIPRCRVVHNLTGYGPMDVLIGKAKFFDVQEGETTEYQKTEAYDVAILVRKSGTGRETDKDPTTAISQYNDRIFEERKFYTVTIQYDADGSGEKIFILQEDPNPLLEEYGLSE